MRSDFWLLGGAVGSGASWAGSLCKGILACSHAPKKYNHPMKQSGKLIHLTAIAFMAIALAGCENARSATATATQRPTNMPAPTGTATPTAVPTFTPTPTETPIPEGIAGIDYPVISNGVDIKVSVEAFSTYYLPETGVTFNMPPGVTGFAVVFETSVDDETFLNWLSSDELTITYSNGEVQGDLSGALAGSKRTLMVGGKNITMVSMTLPGGIVIDLSSLPQTVP